MQFTLIGIHNFSKVLEKNTYHEDWTLMELKTAG